MQNRAHHGAIHLVATLMALMLGVGLAGNASAVTIRVSQESAPGAGDFDANVLGLIDSYDTALGIAGFYQYNVPNAASYNGELNGGPIPISSLTQGFFVNAADGLHYVVVHDNPNDGSGGSTQMTTTLLGGAGGGTVFSVEDDPAEGSAISDVAGDRVFDTFHNWLDCCTDGYAIGALVGDVTLYASFDALPTGISSWQSTGSTTANIAMVLTPGRRVRYDISVPEPGVLALLTVGLLTIAVAQRRRTTAAA